MHLEPAKKNNYFFLRLKIVWSIFRKGKVSLKKIINLGHCWFAHKFHGLKSSKYPYMINFELWNECNAQCTFCRTDEGEIYDQNSANMESSRISKGKMSIELYKDVIEQAKDHILIAVLYVNGEPLIYKPLYEALRFAHERKVATIISTNGDLMNEQNARKLLDSGLDFIKIAISGFTQPTYKVEHRGCDIERVKSNIRNLVRMKKEGGHSLVIMLDFMLYNYNAHELELAREFAAELEIMFSIRRGNLFKLEEERPDLIPTEPPRPKVDFPVKDLCEWPWKVMTINWNGDIFPCCDYVVWNDVEPYTTFIPGQTILSDVWNGPEVVKTRDTHCTVGRGGMDICSKCDRTTTAFKF